ncbi:MAG: protein jag [Thermoleophilaceae bacterium]
MAAEREEDEEELTGPPGELEELPETPVERVHAVVARIAKELGDAAEVEVEMEETSEAITATVLGEDLGLVIGRHGATIDALQHLAGRAAFRDDDERKRVVVDAAGYRARREEVLTSAADRAVEEALATDAPADLEPMSAAERRIVHTYLKDHAEVETHSEGDEPDRRLVVTPTRAD